MNQTLSPEAAPSQALSHYSGTTQDRTAPWRLRQLVYASAEAAQKCALKPSRTGIQKTRLDSEMERVQSRVCFLPGPQIGSAKEQEEPFLCPILDSGNCTSTEMRDLTLFYT